MQEELNGMSCKEAELLERRKGDKGKVAIARRLRQETGMSYQWIAQRLRMGTWTYVWNLLAAQRSPNPALPANTKCK